MNLPGFTAEVSVYRTSGRYRGGGAQPQTVAGLSPAFLDSACFQNCYGGCNLECFELTGSARGACLRDCQEVHQICTERCTRPGPPPQPPPEPADCLYGHWCGPGCGGGDPIDNLDSCCKKHDECYDRRGWGACSCDAELIACALPKTFDILHPKKAAAAAVVVSVFSAKISSGACNPFESPRRLPGASLPSAPQVLAR